MVGAATMVDTSIAYRAGLALCICVASGLDHLVSGLDIKSLIDIADTECAIILSDEAFAGVDIATGGDA